MVLEPTWTACPCSSRLLRIAIVATLHSAGRFSVLWLRGCKNDLKVVSGRLSKTLDGHIPLKTSRTDHALESTKTWRPSAFRFLTSLTQVRSGQEVRRVGFAHLALIDLRRQMGPNVCIFLIFEPLQQNLVKDAKDSNYTTRASRGLFTALEAF